MADFLFLQMLELQQALAASQAKIAEQELQQLKLQQKLQEKETQSKKIKKGNHF